MFAELTTVDGTNSDHEKDVEHSRPDNGSRSDVRFSDEHA